MPSPHTGLLSAPDYCSGMPRAAAPRAIARVNLMSRFEVGKGKADFNEQGDLEFENPTSSIQQKGSRVYVEILAL
jgi:hypothetical protein